MLIYLFLTSGTAKRLWTYLRTCDSSSNSLVYLLLYFTFSTTSSLIPVARLRVFPQNVFIFPSAILFPEEISSLLSHFAHFCFSCKDHAPALPSRMARLARPNKYFLCYLSHNNPVLFFSVEPSINLSKLKGPVERSNAVRGCTRLRPDED